MATLVSVVTLVLTGELLTPAKVFLLLAFIGQQQVSFCMDLPNGLLETYDAYVSLGRLEQFLFLENLSSIGRNQNGLERGTYLKGRSPTDHQQAGHDVSVPNILVRNLTFGQIKEEDKFILKDVEVTAALGSLTVITGPVGCGKSTLLSAIAGEASNARGTISYKGSIVYVPQIAWVFSGSIRENILFCEPYVETKYTRILEACALTEDIQQFPDGDQTVIGERGEVLSGGQRARVSLARAVYADADIYLLDDPLSAVDFNVGQHIFEKCIIGLLGQKTRVIASHQEQFMKEADTVMVLYKGRVLGKGSFIELKEKGLLNTTVDPLLKKVNENKSDNSSATEGEEEDEFSDGSGRIVLQTNETKGLQISEEDRTIGRVSSKLYWNYFRGGATWPTVFTVICWCLITQGKPPQVFLLRLLRRNTTTL